MKKTSSLIFAFLLFSIACKKNAGSTGPSFRFKANGMQYVVNGKYPYYSLIIDHQLGCVLWGSSGYFYPTGANPTLGAPYFQSLFTSDTVLQVKTYYAAGSPTPSVNAFCQLSDSGTQYQINYSDTTNVTITITKFQDSLVSGTFSAYLNPGLTISEGEFNNIKVYRR